MKTHHDRVFAQQALIAVSKRPGQDEFELAESMGIDIRNDIDAFRRNLGLARDRQAIHLRDGKYYPGSRPLDC